MSSFFPRQRYQFARSHCLIMGVAASEDGLILVVKFDGRVPKALALLVEPEPVKKGEKRQHRIAASDFANLQPKLVH